MKCTCWAAGLLAVGLVTLFIAGCYTDDYVTRLLNVLLFNLGMFFGMYGEAAARYWALCKPDELPKHDEAL